MGSWMGRFQDLKGLEEGRLGRFRVEVEASDSPLTALHWMDVLVVYPLAWSGEILTATL